MPKETPLDEYGQDYYETYGQKYYASGLGPIPYERSAHWVNFFSIIADEIIRSIQPLRVLDAGCAMGFLVEALWDRGIHCEGIDISEYAISKVRPDVRDYCVVGSLTDPISGRFDLITCIEVLEHLPPELARPAIANLCKASDAVLFSSTPSDFDEATHLNVRPAFYWLKLFSEFDFWPDARFDAGFIAPHAMLLKKGQRPSDDFLRLFSEYIRYKTALEARSAELRRLESQLNGLRDAGTELSLLKPLLEAREAEIKQLNYQVNELELEIKLIELKLANSSSERDRLVVQIQQFKIAHADRDSLATEAQAVADELQRQRNEVARLYSDRAAIGTTLHMVLSSRAWRLAEKFRGPVRKLRTDWPSAYRVIRSIAGRGKTGADSPAPASPAPSSPALSSASPVPITQDEPYQRWIDEHEPSREQLAAQRGAAESLNGPLFSIVMPVHQTDHSMLQACVQSVLEQTYPRWELCIAITPGGDSRNRQFLLKLAKTDNRFRILELSQNQGISDNSNSAIGLAKGDFIALLDHDDTLASFALFEVASRLLTQPDADIIYSDHDYLDGASGLRRDPLFKPDWSPAIMFSANYITHLTVLRKSLLERTGRFNPATDGAQDWDLFLRATEITSRISHIPKILYHWRMHSGSTARNDSAKNYVADAQLLALRAHMERSAIDAQPEVMPNGLLHVRFTSAPAGMVSIVIPTKDRVDLLSRAISSLLAVTRHANFEILIVDNGSQESATKEYFRSLENDGRIRVLWHPGPFNYSSVNNRAAREAKGEFLLFLNNDVEITHPDWLTELVSWANLPMIGIVGAKLLRKNGTIQHAGVVLGMSGFADHPFADCQPLTFGLAGSTGWYRDFLAVTGACMMMRRQIFDEFRGFDETFTLCGSDVEICLRVHERGYQVLFNPFAELVHYEQQTRGINVPPEDFIESLKHYRRWLISGDPYWNPNLSLWERLPAFRYSKEESSLDFAEKHVRSVQGALSTPRPLSEEDRMVGWFDCGEERFQRLHEQALSAATLGYRPVERILWFIPPFQYPYYGGAHTILRFADSWSRDHGVESLFAVCGAVDHNTMAKRIRQVYPDLQSENLFVLETTPRAADLPPVDASICTLWTTAYYAIHHENATRRFYLIQDYEPAFYRAGSASALAESTYRMGLYGIANTVSLRKMYESEYGGKAVHFTQSIADSVFYPAEDKPASISSRPLQVVCYGRPDNARNAFEILKKAMRLLKQRLGDRVRIVSAGEPWTPSEFGLQGIVENLGVLSYEDSARLYRESDVGVVMMLTRHPSYIPLEMMASGCVTVTNINSWTSWLLKDGENCLLAHSTAASLADTVERALVDSELRDKIRSSAREFVHSSFLDWSAQAGKIYDYLCDPEAIIANEGNNGENRRIRERPVRQAKVKSEETGEPTVRVADYLVPARLARLTGCAAEDFEAYGNAQFHTPTIPPYPAK